MNSPGAEPRPFTLTEWLILIVASIGFLFDTYELLLLPLIAAPAIAEILQVPANHPLVTQWVGRMLWWAALSGGGCGLLGGWLTDRFGRKRVYLLGCAVMVLFPFVYYGLLDTRVAAVVFLAIVVSLPLHDMQYGPQAALIAESFTGRLRYSGASLGYQLASIIAGGPAPIVATFLVNQFHTSLAVSIYLAVCAAVSVLATMGLADNRARDITREYDEVRTAVGGT